MELQAVNDTLKRCLDDLEARIDPQEEDAILQAWRDFSEDRFHGDIFSPQRSRPNPPQVEWPHVSINTALGDFDADGAPAVRRRLEDAGRRGRRGAERALQLRLLHRAAALRRRGVRDGRRAGDAAHLAAAQRQGRHPPADRRGRARSAAPATAHASWRWDTVSRRSPGNTPRSASTSSSTTRTCRGRWISARWCGAARSSTPRWTSRRW